MKLKFFLLTILIALLIYFLTKIDFYQIYLALKNSNLKLIFVAFILTGLNFFIFNIRSVYSFKKILKVDFFFNLKTVMAGFFVNTITPGANIGGEPFRAYFLGEKYKKSKAKILGAIFAERFYHSFVSAFFIVASIFFIIVYIPVSFEIKTILQTIIFFLFLFFGVIIFINFKNKNKKIINLFEKIINFTFRNKRGKLKEIIKGHFGNFIRSFKKTLTNPQIIFVLILLSTIYWILNYFVFYLIFLAIGFKISFFVVIVVLSLTNLVGEFSPIPGGIGIIEGTMIFIYSVMGVSLPISMISTLIYRFFIYFFSLLIGGISFIYLNSLKY